MAKFITDKPINYNGCSFQRNVWGKGEYETFDEGRIKMLQNHPAFKQGLIIQVDDVVLDTLRKEADQRKAMEEEERERFDYSALTWPEIRKAAKVNGVEDYTKKTRPMLEESLREIKWRPMETTS